MLILTKVFKRLINEFNFKLIAMKNQFMFFFLFLFIFCIQAQSYEGKGDNKINLAYALYGIGNGIKASYDYGLSNTFSIGFGGTYFLSNNDEDYFIYCRTSYHFGDLLDLPRQLDIYPGVELGYLSTENIGITGYIGVRYFFTKKLGVFTEIGNNGTFGLTLNL